MPWRLDSTNSSEEHLRNALRARLVPVLPGLFPGWRSAVASLAGRQKLYQRFAEQEAERRLEWEEVPGGYRLELERFLQAPGLLRVLAVYRLFGLPRPARAAPPAPCPSASWPRCSMTGTCRGGACCCGGMGCAWPAGAGTWSPPGILSGAEKKVILW